jgi:hypothetical protein
VDSLFYFILFDFLSGYFLVFFYAIYVLIVWFKDKTRLKIFITKKAMLSYFALFIMLLPVVIPYFVAANKFNAYFDIRDAIHFALQPEDLLFPNNHTRLEPVLLYLFRPLHYSPVGEVKVGYIGLVFSILSIVLLLYQRTKEYISCVFSIRRFWFSCITWAGTSFRKSNYSCTISYSSALCDFVLYCSGFWRF